jgi:hypothetical protein
VDWLRRIPGLTWATLGDLACKPELVSSPDAIRERQIWTRDRAIEFVEAYADETWAWAPTAQGCSLDDDKRSCDDIASLVDELIEYFTLISNDDNDDLWDDEQQCNPWGETIYNFRPGIGSLCARKNVQEIWEIGEYVANRFPGILLHLWGVQLQALEDWPGGVPKQDVSTDSAAWNGRFGSDIATINADQKARGTTDVDSLHDRLVDQVIQLRRGDRGKRRRFSDAQAGGLQQPPCQGTQSEEGRLRDISG